MTIINLEKILKQHDTRHFIIFNYLVPAPFVYPAVGLINRLPFAENVILRMDETHDLLG